MHDLRIFSILFARSPGRQQKPFGSSTELPQATHPPAHLAGLALRLATCVAKCNSSISELVRLGPLFGRFCRRERIARRKSSSSCFWRGLPVQDSLRSTATVFEASSVPYCPEGRRPTRDRGPSLKRRAKLIRRPSIKECWAVLGRMRAQTSACSKKGGNRYRRRSRPHVQRTAHPVQAALPYVRSACLVARCPPIPRSVGPRALVGRRSKARFGASDLRAGSTACDGFTDDAPRRFRPAIRPRTSISPSRPAATSPASRSSDVPGPRGWMMQALCLVACDDRRSIGDTLDFRRPAPDQIGDLV